MSNIAQLTKTGRGTLITKLYQYLIYKELPLEINPSLDVDYEKLKK